MADNIRPWTCTFCHRFEGHTLSSLLKHVRTIHNGPGFSVVCGIDACASKYLSVKSWENHIRKRHRAHMVIVDEENNIEPLEDEDGGILYDDEGIPAEERHIIEDIHDIQTRNATMLLAFKELNKLTQTSTQDFIATTECMIKTALENTMRAVKDNLARQNIPAADVVDEDMKAYVDSLSNPFGACGRTDWQQNKYFTDNFGYLVRLTCI